MKEHLFVWNKKCLS